MEKGEAAQFRDLLLLSEKHVATQRMILPTVCLKTER